MQFLPQQLQAFNTLNLPATASFAVLDNDRQIEHLLNQSEPLFFLGQGSNVVMHKNINNKVIQVALRGIHLQQQTQDFNYVYVAAGENWHDFVQYCLGQAWYGLENLALIPGTVGAAPVQNIGAYGVEVQDLIDTVDVLDIGQQQRITLKKQDCGFAYRDSIFKQAGFGKYLILGVVFAFPRYWQAKLQYHDLQHLQDCQKLSPQDVFATVCDIRQAKLPDPALLPNAGSFFKNPLVPINVLQQLQQTYPDIRYYQMDADTVKLAAAWLIDQAGWRGKRLGPVGMHANQALVLVNYAQADANDVMRLADTIRADIKDKFGVVLEQEPVVLQ